MIKGSTVSMDIREKIRQTLLKRVAEGLCTPPNNKGKKYPRRSLEHRKKIGDNSRGEKSHFWKGGKTELAKSIKNMTEYKQWRSSVFERDDYTCQQCFKRGGLELAPDHILPFSVIVETNSITNQEEARKCAELWDIRNGRTLCRPCHKLTDTYGWKLYNKTKSK